MSKSTILMAIAVVGLISAGRSWVKGEPADPRIFFGVLFAAALLLVIAEFNEGFAGALAALLFFSAVFAGGPDIWNVIRQNIAPGEGE